jgi:hypothetical protein
MVWNGMDGMVFFGGEQTSIRSVYVEQLAQFEIREKDRRQTSDMVN